MTKHAYICKYKVQCAKRLIVDLSGWQPSPPREKQTIYMSLYIGEKPYRCDEPDHMYIIYVYRQQARLDPFCEHTSWSFPLSHTQYTIPTCSHPTVTPGCALFLHHLTAWSLMQTIRDGKSIIIEGLHLDPGLYLEEFGKYGIRHLHTRNDSLLPSQGSTAHQEAAVLVEPVNPEPINEDKAVQRGAELEPQG